MIRDLSCFKEKEIINRKELIKIENILDIKKYKLVINYLNKDITIDNDGSVDIKHAINFACNDLPHNKIILDSVVYDNINNIATIKINPLISSA